MLVFIPALAFLKLVHHLAVGNKRIHGVVQGFSCPDNN
jgi:hypothetical protein